MALYFIIGLLAVLLCVAAALWYIARKAQQQLAELNATLTKLNIDAIKVGNEQVKGLVEIARNTYRIR